MKKIVKGNDFTMKIPVSKYDGGQLINYSLPGCTDIQVSLLSGLNKRYQLTFNIGVDDDYVIYAHVNGNEIPLGIYSLEVKGKKYNISWRSNEYEQICFVDANKDGDTAFEPDEGDNSIEMNTAVVILARDVDQIYNSLDEIVNDLSGLKLDTSISPTKYYQKDYINKLAETINSSILNVSSNLNDTSVRLNNVTEKVDKCSTDINGISEKLYNCSNNIDNVSSKIDDVSSRLKDNYLTKSQHKQSMDSSFAQLDKQIKNIDVTKQLTPINDNIKSLNQKTDTIGKSLNTVESKINNLIGSDVRNGTIDTFNDVQRFLSNISDSSTLTELLKKKGDDSPISPDVLKNYYTKDVIDNVSTDISTKIGNISTKLNEVSNKIKPINDNITSLNGKTNAVESKLNDLIGTDSKNGTIDTFNDVKKFFADISDSSTLTELLKKNSGGSSISPDVLENYYTKEVVDNVSTDISTKINKINITLTSDKQKIDNNTISNQNTSSRLNDVSSRLNDSSSRINNVSSRLNDSSSRINNVSSRLNDVSIKLDDVISKINNGGGSSETPASGGVTLEQYLKDEELIASTLNDLNNTINENKDYITRRLNTALSKVNRKIISETSKYLLTEQYLKDEELIASTLNDLNNKISSLQKEVDELKNNKK